jgi:thioredoxin reductase
MSGDGIVIVGGGPAGLACAIELRRRGVDDVVVLDREPRAGGIPRHCGHQGFGLRDLHRPLPGPRYARHYVEAARHAGAVVREETMVTGWSTDGSLEVTSPDGREALRPHALVLATGCRERPRSARLVPGSRPEGVMTTGQLQQLVELGLPVGRRAMVVGAEHVSFSALLTLGHAGTRVAGMATDLPHHQSVALAPAAAALRYRAPLWTRTAVAAIHGRARVEAVELVDLDSGAVRAVECDTAVFTGDWIPDHELAVTGEVPLDPGTHGPRVDTALRSARSGVFAAGNLLHGAEPADVAALDGRHAAESVTAWLAGDGDWPAAPVPVVCHPPLRWIAPNAIAPGAEPPPRGRFALRSTEFLRGVEVEVRQGGRVLWRGRLRRLVPGRSTRLPAGWIAAVDGAGDEVELRVAEPGRRG